MIIFNGMYFRGSWKKPFDKVEPGLFYKSSSEKKQVPMMKTSGTYKTAYLSGLDSEAIQLPYDVSFMAGLQIWTTHCLHTLHGSFCFDSKHTWKEPSIEENTDLNFGS